MELPDELLERSDVEASVLTEYDGYEDEDDDDEQRRERERQAGRFGIMLLEENAELKSEIAALRAQAKALESERPGLLQELQKNASELETLREERRQSLMEVTRLQAELRSKSVVVTSCLDREHRLKEAKEAAEAQQTQAEDKMKRLQSELDELMAWKAASEQSLMMKKDEVVVQNPAATYDSNQSSTFTLEEHEELLAKWHRAAEENDAMHLEVRSLRKDLDAMKRKTSKMSELKLLVERLEKKALKLQHANDALQEELAEGRKLIESQQTMMGVYKKIADARPFSAECTCVLHPEGDERDGLGVSIQEQLLDTNMRLEKDLRELRAQLASVNEDKPPTEDTSDNNSSRSSNVAEDEGDYAVEALEAEQQIESEAVSALVADVATTTADVDHLIKRIQDLEEKNSALKDSLRHAKQQWQGAIASQKALEECNGALQAELDRTQKGLDFKVSVLTEPQADNSNQSANEEGADPATRRAATLAKDDDDEKWTEETAPYPAPPGDLNSPLIKCLLDHWTTDKSKIMHLTDWLHHAIRGTGKPRPLRLEHLTSEVAAGFTQLLVPILRERHGVSVTIYRRESFQVLTDMVFQAHQPSQEPEAPSIFSTIAAKISEVLTSAPSSAELTPVSDVPRQSRLDRSASTGSVGSSESGSASSSTKARRRRQESPMLMGEAQFLYG